MKRLSDHRTGWNWVRNCRLQAGRFQAGQCQQMDRHSQRMVLMIMGGFVGLGVGLLLATPVSAEASLQNAQVSNEASGHDSPDAVNPPAAVESIAIDSTAASSVAANSRVVLSLAERRVYLYRNNMLISSYPVAVGTDETPTPQGQFTVSQMVENPVWQSPWTGEVHEPGPDSALGLRWIEFATSPEGAFGFHGTPTLDSIGHAASNGCVRMRNEDVVALFAQVNVGTPVIVQP
ncbi:MAG: L,D-transpeptidase [Cyanobacteria bacterium P01_F01_bin.53]